MLSLLFKDPPDNTFVRLATGIYGADAKLDLHDVFIDSKVAGVDTAAVMASLGTNINVFFTPAVYNIQRTGYKNAVAASRCAWVDIDKDAPPPCAYPPSIIAMSGHGYHYYWLFSSWLEDIEILEKINKSLEDDTYKGGGCWNANRIMRLPGSTNAKPGEPVIDSKIILVRPDVVYNVDDFDIYKKLDNKTKDKMGTGNSQGFRSKSERDWHIVRRLLGCGASEELVRRLAYISIWGADVRAKGTPYLDRTIAKAKESVDKDPGRSTGTIEEGDDGYYLVLSNGGRKRVTTFVFEPGLLLEHPEGDAIQGSIRAAGTSHVWEGIVFTRAAFNCASNLSKQLPLAAWQLLGGDTEVKLLLPYLMNKLFAKGMPKVKATSVLGYHDGMFVGVDNVITVNEVLTANRPIVYLDNGRERSSFLTSALSTTGNILQTSKLGRLNTAGTIYPVLGWFAASLFKTMLETIGVRMPSLNCYGTRGSGKTTTIHLLQRLFGVQVPVSYDCNTTRFVALTLLGSTNCVPISFSEYRSSHGIGFLRFVLLAYDSGHDARGRADQTTVSYPLTAPIVLDGEDMVADPAAKERIIAVPFHPEELTDERKDAFRSITDEEINSFAVPHLQRVLTTDVPSLWRKAYTWTQSAFTDPLPQRVRNNLAVVVLGLLALEIQPKKEYLEACVGSVYDVKKQRTSALVDDFIEAITNAVAQKNSEFAWYIDGENLYFHFAQAYVWWLKEMMRSRQPVLAKEALKVQMTERYGNGPGQYLSPPVDHEGYRMHVVHMTRAVESGLDIRVVKNTEVTINYEQ